MADTDKPCQDCLSRQVRFEVYLQFTVKRKLFSPDTEESNCREWFRVKTLEAGLVGKS